MDEKETAISTADVLFFYDRVSTPEQEGTLDSQHETNLQYINGVKTKKNVKIFRYSEQASGTKNPLEDPKNRPELLRLLKEALEYGEKNPKKEALVVVRDIQRFTRDPYDLGELYNPLRRKNIPIVSVNEPIRTGTPQRPNPTADLLAPILTAAGGSEVQTRLLQTQQGVARSRDAGIFAGTPLSLYPDEALSLIHI